MWWGIYNQPPPSARVGGTPRKNHRDKKFLGLHAIFLCVGKVFVIA
jgi:hypothetical protein